MVFGFDEGFPEKLAREGDIPTRPEEEEGFRLHQK